jgi:hypothetical protein
VRLLLPALVCPNFVLASSWCRRRHQATAAEARYRANPTLNG